MTNIELNEVFGINKFVFQLVVIVVTGSFIIIKVRLIFSQEPIIN